MQEDVTIALQLRQSTFESGNMYNRLAIQIYTAFDYIQVHGDLPPMYKAMAFCELFTCESCRSASTGPSWCIVAGFEPP